MLPSPEKARLETFSAVPRDDSTGELPGTDQEDEEGLMFLASLQDDDREFLEQHLGLGNSQKAEVAWLEKRYSETGNKGFLYQELDVRDFLASIGIGNPPPGGVAACAVVPCF
jgi:hypothetical protein